jgi:hypothetical protein
MKEYIYTVGIRIPKTFENRTFSVLVFEWLKPFENWTNHPVFEWSATIFLTTSLDHYILKNIQ